MSPPFLDGISLWRPFACFLRFPLTFCPFSVLSPLHLVVSTLFPHSYGNKLALFDGCLLAYLSHTQGYCGLSSEVRWWFSACPCALPSASGAGIPVPVELGSTPFPSFSPRLVTIRRPLAFSILFTCHHPGFLPIFP